MDLPCGLVMRDHRLGAQCGTRAIRNSQWLLHVYKGSGSRGRVRVHLRGGSQLFDLQGEDRCQISKRGEKSTLREGS